MKIRSAVPENSCLIFCGGQKKQKKTEKNKKNICKTYTHPPHRRLRKKKKTLMYMNVTELYVLSRAGRWEKLMKAVSRIGNSVVKRAWSAFSTIRLKVKITTTVERRATVSIGADF